MPPTFDAQAFEKDVAQILTALDAAQQQALTTQTQELAARIDALSTKVSDQQLHIDALQKQLDAQNDLIAKLDGVISRLEADIPQRAESVSQAHASGRSSVERTV